MRVRRALPEDDEALHQIDLDTWSESITPAPRPTPAGRFFTTPAAHQDVLVAEIEGRVAGYVTVVPQTTLASSAHVLQIRGLAVAPQHQGAGVGERLVQAAAEHARQRGARRLTLRVLGPNGAARRLYERCGFVVEGVQRELFVLDGRYVDDVLLVLALSP